MDVGAGTGILSFFAAAAGASKVIAVEFDPTLAASLRASVSANGLAHIVEVIEGNVLSADLPRDVDVVIAELIDTGLLDETQVPVLASLKERGVAGKHTRFIPQGYETYLELVETTNEYYGFKILAPKHEWPFYAQGATAGWLESDEKLVSDRVLAFSVDFCEDELPDHVSRSVTFDCAPGSHPNAVRLSGVALLSDTLSIGACNSLNGDKVLPLAPFQSESMACFRVLYELGGGLGSFRMIREQEASSPSG